MKRKLLLVVAMVIALVSVLAVSVGASSIPENYSYEYVLGDKTTLVHYTKFNYTGTSGQVDAYAEWKDEITITYLDEEGNSLTKVPMWEYDQEDGKYYGLVWYIVEQQLTNTWTDQYVWAQGPNGYANQYDTEGDQRPKYTSAVYTLAKVRAVDLTYETVTEKKTFTFDSTNYHGENSKWEWSRNDDGVSYKVLKSIYLDAEKTTRLQAPVYGNYKDMVNAGYGTYEKQWEVVGDRIVAANFKDLDFQAHYYHWSNPSCWSFVSNLQCLWYPDTFLYLQSSVGGGIREIEFEGIEVIACQLFRDCKYLTEFRVPPKCEFLNDELFRSSGLKTIIYGESIKFVKHSMFSGIAPTTYYMSKNIISDSYVTGYTNTTWGYGYLVNNTKATIYFVGSLSDAQTLWARMSADNSSYSEVHYYDYNQVQERETTTGVAIFYNYNRCDAFYKGTHVADDEMLGKFLGQEFMSDYKVYTECGRDCGAENIVETVGALVYNNGYAVEEYSGAKSVIHSFVIDKNVLSKYQGYFPDLRFGVLAVGENPSSPFEGNLIDAQGNKAHDKIAMVDFTDKGFDMISLRLVGFNGNEDTNVYLCGYVIGGEKAYYIQNGNVSTTATTTTYTQIEALLNGEEN